MQSVPIITKVVISNPAHGEVYSIQHYVIKQFVSDRSWFSSVTSTNKTDRHDIEILLKVPLNTITLYTYSAWLSFPIFHIWISPGPSSASSIRCKESILPWHDTARYCDCPLCNWGWGHQASPQTGPPANKKAKSTNTIYNYEKKT